MLLIFYTWRGCIKNLNTASQRICKKRFKDVLADFMNEEQERYVADIKQRRNAPRANWLW